ncbi:hypothetical protein [Neobacillus paridis]|nr:hypothetical protein [Neobacillus paridis]
MKKSKWIGAGVVALAVLLIGAPFFQRNGSLKKPRTHSVRSKMTK